MGHGTRGAPRRRGPTCTDRSHRRVPGTNTCLVCRANRQRQRVAEKRAARGEVLLQRPGMSAHRAGALAMWERRRKVYGPTGARPPAERPKVWRATPAHPRKTHCTRGHPLDAANTTTHRYRHTVRRRCVTCARLKRHGVERPPMVMVGTVRVSVAAHDAWCVQEGRRLFADVAAAHPDRPRGSAAKFRAAMKRWRRFVAEQEEWYRLAALPLPAGMKGHGAP